MYFSLVLGLMPFFRPTRPVLYRGSISFHSSPLYPPSPLPVSCGRPCSLLGLLVCILLRPKFQIVTRILQVI
jgi:hypothetical protein